MNIERWRPIEGTNGAYEVSDYGRVRSLERRSENSKGVKISIPGRILSPATDRCGYKTVVLRIDKRNKTFRVHRLVAIAFVPKAPKKEFIDHIDNNKENNHYTNLRWVTRSENMLNPITVAKQKAKLSSRESRNAKKVYQYTPDRHFIRSYQSISDAARKNGLKKSGIKSAIRGQYKKHGGYLWSLAPLK